MVRSVAARGKLALEFWMLFSSCGQGRREGAVEVYGIRDLDEAGHRAFDLGARSPF